MDKVKNPRAFSLEETFMNYKVDDILFGFMRGLSTVRPPVEGQEHREYLIKKNYTKNKKLIAGICGCSTKTIDRHLDKLFENGLIDEGIEVINGKDVPCYWFPKVEGKYEIVEQDMVRHLVNTRSQNTIKIYIYLLNKYKWKRQTNDKYVFTERELGSALGYSENTDTFYEPMKYLLASLMSEGLITYKKIKCEIEDIESTKTTYRYLLIDVCENFEELKDIYEKRKCI